MSILKSIGKAIGSVASPLVSGAFGVGSALLNNKAQSNANSTNIKIAQMNNEWSEKMMEKQNLMNIDQWNREAAYNTEMWNKTNEYNSAKAQSERFKEAGLNPAIMMGQNAGTASASSAPSGNSVGLPSPSSASVQPLRYEGFANAINNSIQMSMALDRHNSEMDALGRNTAMNLALARAKIAQMYEQTRGEKFKNELNDITKDLQLGMANEDFLKRINERYLVGEQEKLVKQQRLAQEFITQNIPEKFAMEIAVMASQRDLNEFNSSIRVGKFMDEIKKRGINLSPTWEKIIFATLLAGEALR